MNGARRSRLDNALATPRCDWPEPHRARPPQRSRRPRTRVQATRHPTPLRRRASLVARHLAKSHTRDAPRRRLLTAELNDTDAIAEGEADQNRAGPHRWTQAEARNAARLSRESRATRRRSEPPSDAEIERGLRARAVSDSTCCRDPSPLAAAPSCLRLARWSTGNRIASRFADRSGCSNPQEAPSRGS
jgi:hypothetical protein